MHALGSVITRRLNTPLKRIANHLTTIWCVLEVALFLASSTTYAQSIYKCPSRHGGYEYTDMPCTGPKAVVIHKATPGELSEKQDASDRQTMLSMLRNNQIDAARRYAVMHNKEPLYNSIVASLVKEAALAKQRRQQQIQVERQRQTQVIRDRVVNLSAQNEALQEQLDAQSQELEFQQQRAEDADRRARRARRNAGAPRFNPQAGQWCLQSGGTVQCH